MSSADIRIQVAPLPSKAESRRRTNPFVLAGRFLKLALGIFLLARQHE